MKETIKHLENGDFEVERIKKNKTCDMCDCVITHKRNLCKDCWNDVNC